MLTDLFDGYCTRGGAGNPMAMLKDSVINSKQRCKGRRREALSA